MSRSIHIICTQCRKKLWAGQASYIYTQPENQMAAFNRFVCDHFGHPVMFVDDNYDSLIESCEDVTPRADLKLRVPPGYTADELDRDNPYTQHI